MKKFGVGLIGVEPNRSWAARAHIPALISLSDRFRIVGVANSTPASGQKAAEALGIAKSFATVDELVSSPEIDVVAVMVKVPKHMELVSKALLAGKHVYCEWPLGRTLEEAEHLEQLAKNVGVHAIAGMQALRSPAVRYAKQLIENGYVGEVLSITLVGNGGLGGGQVNAPDAYTVDVNNGATVLSIPFGHTLAALVDIFGEPEAIRSQLGTLRREVTVTQSGEKIAATSPDQVLVSATFQDKIAFSAHYRGGLNAGTGLLLEIAGTDGMLQITGPLGHLQLVPLTLKGAHGAGATLEVLSIPGEFLPKSDATGPAANVAAVYADLYNDLTNGGNSAPVFSDAVRVHRILQAIENSAGVTRS